MLNVCQVEEYPVQEAQVEGLDQFLQEWDEEYKNKARQIALFDAKQTSQWSEEQRKYFVKVLYHQRAHFDAVLWYMGNFAPSKEFKELILENTRDEFGRSGRSHEQLYLDFAKSMGVDLTYEMLEEKFYLPFLKEYNQGYLYWFREHDWTHRLSAFAALERLDNVDYSHLKGVVNSFGVEKPDVLFFDVHIHVKHFESIQACNFHDVWNQHSKTVQDVFMFVGKAQLSIWEKISDTVFNS